MVKYLLKHYDLSKVDMVGASAGALIVTLAMCKVDPDKAIQTAYKLAEEHNVWNRRLGLAGIWGGLVRQWLHTLLPDNAPEVCRDRLKLVITRVPFLDIAYVYDFTSKQDLIDACLASAHVPFFLDGNAYCTYRGQRCIDGSLSDFITKGNSELLQCNGSAFIMDYYEDTALSVGRWDFLKLRSYEEVMALVQSGYDYAERTDAANGFHATLASVSYRKLEHSVKS